MAETSFRLEVVTPEKVIFDGRVTTLTLPAVDGLMGVLPNHAPIVTALTVGPLVAKDTTGKDILMVVSDGFFEMANNHAKVIADAGEDAAAIDPKRAEEAEKRARERLKLSGKRDAKDIDFVRAERALMRAVWRLRVRRRYGR